MNCEIGKMSILPMLLQGADRYDVVFMGNVVPKYKKSHMTNLLFNDYVFLFTTTLDQEDSDNYGHVKIDLVRHDQLSYFNHRLRERGSFHVLGNESLILNDFLEIVLEETEKGIQIIAHLKMQNILGEDDCIAMTVRDFRVLLLRENKDGRYDNYPILELGPEFQAEIDLAEAGQRYCALRDTSSILREIGNRNERNPEVIDAINIAQVALDKDINDAKLKEEQAYEHCLYYIGNLLYINKRSHS